VKSRTDWEEIVSVKQTKPHFYFFYFLFLFCPLTSSHCPLSLPPLGRWRSCLSSKMFLLVVLLLLLMSPATRLQTIGKMPSLSPPFFLFYSVWLTFLPFSPQATGPCSLHTHALPFSSPNMNPISMIIFSSLSSLSEPSFLFQSKSALQRLCCQLLQQQQHHLLSIHEQWLCQEAPSFKSFFLSQFFKPTFFPSKGEKELTPSREIFAGFVAGGRFSPHLKKKKREKNKTNQTKPKKGCSSGLVASPLELIMIQQQRKGGSLPATIQRLMAKPKDMYRGFYNSFLREGIFAASYLGVRVTFFFDDGVGRRGGKIPAHPRKQQNQKVCPVIRKKLRVLFPDSIGKTENRARIAASIIGGLCASALSHPTDTGKAGKTSNNNNSNLNSQDVHAGGCGTEEIQRLPSHLQNSVGRRRKEWVCQKWEL